FGNQRTVNVVAARENVGSKDSAYHKEKMLMRKQAEQGVPLQADQYDWVKDFAYHKEKMLLCKQAEKGVSLQAEQSDWLADTNEEIHEQELEHIQLYGKDLGSSYIRFRHRF
nr:hypothetical protein [Tanacetum cinerariifolium]